MVNLTLAFLFSTVRKNAINTYIHSSAFLPVLRLQGRAAREEKQTKFDGSVHPKRQSESENDKRAK